MSPRPRHNRFFLIAVSWAGAVSCGTPAPPAEEPTTVTYETIEDAHAALTARLIDRTGVSGTAIGACDGNPCIKVYVVDSDTEARAEIPESFGGFPVDVEVTGTFRARGTGG